MNSDPKQIDKPDMLARKKEDFAYIAGEVAHDFNGLLTGIMGYASYLKALLPKNDKTFQAANSIEISARRAAELTRRMTEYSNKEMSAPTPLKLDQIVETAINDLSISAADNVRISTKLETPSGLVMGDPNALCRALFHLGKNAIDAMPAGGRLTFSMRPFVSGGNIAFDGFYIPEGDYVSIVVSDTGCGIPESLWKQVFDCFFTTKPEGNGIGLPLVTRCVRKHGGFLRMESQEGGTTFEILLPVIPSSS